jgi:hypothetical protein
MLAKTWTLAIVVVGLLGTTLARVEVAGQTPDNRAERLRGRPTTPRYRTSRRSRFSTTCTTSGSDMSGPGW